MGKPVIWAEMTVEEISEYLKKRPTVILPLGCTEQHGYHLPTSVDILNRLVAVTSQTSQAPLR